MNPQALEYYMHDGATAFRFELSGCLDHEGARRLDQARRTASSVIGVRSLVVEMTFVTGVDEDGRTLLLRWHRDGARIVANSKASRALAEAIVGGPLPEPASNAHRTWLPFRISFSTLCLMLFLLFPLGSRAATLKSETVSAWQKYLQTVNAGLDDRLRPGGSFLWTLENAERAAKVHSGEIVVAPAPGHNPKKVPGGLIHHWTGALFLPGVKLDDVLDVTRDYDHYKEFYRPSVVESRTISRRGMDDKFSMLLMNKAFFLLTALDADYDSNNVRLDDRRFYSVSRTTRVQEVEDYGQPGEHLIPQGQGDGYIWKLYSIARLEQKDGGVYVELEAIALSRDIPVALRFVADPIVRRVSRNSLLVSLRQTEEAVRGTFLTVSRTAGNPAAVRPLPDTPASLADHRSAFVGIR